MWQALVKVLVEVVVEEIVEQVKEAARPVQVQVSVDLDLSNLNKLRGKARAAVMKAVARAVKPVRAAVVAGAGRIKRFGWLAKSIGTKVKIYPGGVVAIVGPKMSFKRKAKSKGKDGKRADIRPYKYAWLVEKGTRRSAKKPFLAPAEASAASRYRQTAVSEIRKELAAINGNAE